MFMKNRLIVLIGVGALFSSLVVIAAGTDNDAVFMALDKDKNGMISKDEVSSAKKLMDDWSKIDTNKNGTIEKAEFAALESATAYTPEESENEPIGAAPMK